MSQCPNCNRLRADRDEARRENERLKVELQQLRDRLAKGMKPRNKVVDAVAAAGSPRSSGSSPRSPGGSKSKARSRFIAIPPAAVQSGSGTPSSPFTSYGCVFYS
mmetsp:Transcript_48502/g.113878  ORF Transcript_48502/g.113878 Transcript_48502/m.113878 type:complete len:105 (-) Transcript_48502:102-416(-)